jgi:hypothetical protein
MSRKDKLSKEIKTTRTSKNVEVSNEDTFVDFNPLDVLPEIIDKDYGFFLMFGHPDNPISGTASSNLDSERSYSLPQK